MGLFMHSQLRLMICGVFNKRIRIHIGRIQGKIYETEAILKTERKIKTKPQN